MTKPPKERVKDILYYEVVSVHQRYRFFPLITDILTLGDPFVSNV